MTNTIGPAEGERAAARGYVNQYLVAAEIILDALVEGSLEWIRVADPEAGRLDDIQIARPHRFDAYQVKWSEYSKNITFNNLFSEDSGSPPLIAQLSDGWKRLSEKYLDREVTVHLVSNRNPSTGDRIPVEADSPGPYHFAAFLRHCWGNREGWCKEEIQIPPKWKPAVERIQEESGLEPTTFLKFAFACNFAVGYHLRLESDDIKRIANLLWEIVADDRREVEIQKDDLISRLGWQDRFQFRSRHEFPVDESLYQPIETTIAGLEVAIEQSDSGYIALIGTPGSGKSTTLTKTYRYHPQYRVIRYYAFVPDDPNLTSPPYFDPG